MKYLVKTIKHITGEEFTDIIRVKNNEDYIIVEAESKVEAEEMAEGEVVLRPIITKNYQPPEFDDESGDKEISRKDIERAMQRKDSE